MNEPKENFWAPNPNPGPYHVISRERLMEMLQRVYEGETPEMVYIEEYVNADSEVT